MKWPSSRAPAARNSTSTSSFGATPTASAGPALDGRDAGRGAQRRLHPQQVLEALDLDVEHHLDDVLAAPAHADVVDVGPLPADHGADRAQRARLVERAHQQPGRDLGGRLLGVPPERHGAAVLVDRARQDRALGPVHADRPPGADDADDRVARHRVAAVGEAVSDAWGEPDEGCAGGLLRRGGSRPAQRDDAQGAVVGLLLAPQLRVERLEHGPGAERALADRGVEVVDAALVQRLQHLLEQAVGHHHLLRAGGALERLLALRQVLVALLAAKVAADPRPRLPSDDEPLPLRRGPGVLARDDVDLVAVLQPGPELDHAAVDLGAHATVADLGVDRVGEVDRRGAARKCYQVALGGEAEHLVLEHLHFGVLEEVLGTAGVLQDVQELPDPAVLPALSDLGVLLVGPVRRDAELGLLVHLARADLYLDLAVLGTYDRGVE